jgi:hypothetical protein|tara:strand:- start:369 stop:542 length:174 start_codon:yes stop_codon:yes gene_type:complete
MQKTKKIIDKVEFHKFYKEFEKDCIKKNKLFLKKKILIDKMKLKYFSKYFSIQIKKK